jgi:hypothetical protein
MHGIERKIVLAAIAYLAVYLLGFFGTFLVTMHMSRESADLLMLALLLFHFLGMVLNVTAFILTLRDLYLRSFPDPDAKLTWLLLMFLTGGVGWIVYIFRHALRPRGIG